MDLISLEDLTPEDRKQLEILNQEARHKRSGSDDIWSSIKIAIGRGIKKKLAQFAKSSASASARFSSASAHGIAGASSGGHDVHDGHEVHYDHDHHEYHEEPPHLPEVILAYVLSFQKVTFENILVVFRTHLQQTRV